MNQKLDKAEYQNAVKFTFEHFDENKDTYLDRQEFTKMFAGVSKYFNFQLTNQIIDYLFKRFDKNNDGLVEFKDLHEVLNRAYYTA